jgi:two-component system, OmpR family, sensor kinase
VRRISLGLKLAVVVAIAVAVVTAAVAVAFQRSAERHFQGYLNQAVRIRARALVPELVRYYARYGEWAYTEELEATVTGGMGMPRGGSPDPGFVRMVLTDADGVLVAGAPGRRGIRIASDLLDRGLAISSNQRVIGYLVTFAGTRETDLVLGLSRSLMWGGVLAAGVAIILGSVVTHQMLRPLTDLSQAADSIAAGNLEARVEVASDDEVGDLARRFNEMAGALQRDKVLRRTMVADIAHELRTPLAVMRGQIEALQDGVFGTTPENLQPVYEQTLLLTRLVDDLHELSLAEAGHLPMEIGAIDVGDLVRKSLAGFAGQASERDATLLADVEDGLPAVRGDAQRLEQVLNNLISNALRYTPKGGSVTVRAHAQDGGVRVEVEDTGDGVPEEHLDLVFERFYRVDPARDRSAPHSGLGLAISKQLIEAHGGRIGVENAPDAGARFWFWVPAFKEGSRGHHGV